MYFQQVWQWPWEAPGIVGSGLYDITIMCGPKNMSLEKYNFTKKNINNMGIHMNFYIE